MFPRRFAAAPLAAAPLAAAPLAAALLAPALVAAHPAAAQPAAPPAERLDGFLPLRLEASTGRVLVELPADTTRVLLLTSLATGLGSNPVGLDRGANGNSYVARFERSDPRVLVVLENWRYAEARRALAGRGTRSPRRRATRSGRSREVLPPVTRRAVADARDSNYGTAYPQIVPRVVRLLPDVVVTV